MDMQIDEETVAGLRQAGLVPADGTIDCRPLTGGVASDIWLVQGAKAPFVVKRALAKLRVTADWRAPVARNASEVAWLRFVAGILPDCVPAILAHDPKRGFFAMEFLPPDSYPVWKNELRSGRVDADFACAVGTSLATIHASTARRIDIAPQFNEDSVFRALRIEPYLEYTATKHPQIGDPLRVLGAGVLGRHAVLVHGDISPKNILVGPKGPVFLDAECAWFGDPVFDFAFCLNHLLLKCLWAPAYAAAYAASYDALAAAYLAGVTWEDAAALEARAAALLPALLLARIYGRSPVEYVEDDRLKAFVRAFAIPLIMSPPRDLSMIRNAWMTALRNDGIAP
ncbi:Fructosamine-3-kinase [Bosea sp. OK403]|uniref:phosphotransferase family protein n=1 Tax=Bosea sp. OK403 TaxID=1855286 RepID=UPI0008E5B9DA|nr:aminoglycoside phosphotransferase family protein [Bosea sp. OK403]SFJ15713.1 Fructosamine-3-kinase [Bosea sp. OK403]